MFAFSKSVLERPEVWYRTRTETLLLAEGYRGNEPPGFVQDISNQKLVDEVVGYLKEHSKNPLKILDLCSAPGGKSLGLAFAGYDVIATDIDSERLDRVRENVARLELAGKVEVVEYSKVFDSKEKFDLIWVDAPCSSTGIVRRHPEIKWNRTFHDVERMMLAQGALVDWAHHHLNEQGCLLYSTCSLLDLENPDHWPGFESLKRWTWSPQSEPRGDGIRAGLFLKNSV